MRASLHMYTWRWKRLSCHVNSLPTFVLLTTLLFKAQLPLSKLQLCNNHAWMDVEGSSPVTAITFCWSAAQMKLSVQKQTSSSATVHPCTAMYNKGHKLVELFSSLTENPDECGRFMPPVISFTSNHSAGFSGETETWRPTPVKILFFNVFMFLRHFSDEYIKQRVC